MTEPARIQERRSSDDGEESGAPVLEARGLVKHYGSFAAVDGVSFEVRSGEIVGLLGPNGAGKTTTIRMCAGLLRPGAGTVRIGGIDLQKDPRRAKQAVGYVPDEPYLYDKLTAREFVDFMARLYGVPVSPRRRDELLHVFDLDDAAGDLIGGFSHGMRQKTALCGALIHEPQLLFLDEPTVGLDPRSAPVEGHAAGIPRGWPGGVAVYPHPGNSGGHLRSGGHLVPWRGAR